MKRNHLCPRSTARARTRGAPREERAGFTLIEVIVVIIILGVLAAVIAPRVLQRVGQSKKAVAEAGAASLAMAVRLFIADHGRPEVGATIEILWERPGGVPEAQWEPYVENADKLIDPWGARYILKIPGDKNPYDFDVVSLGGDGKPGGAGEDADIVKP
ncbi:MAG: type II secretion system protein GspG [Alphaproteobacteria bacterium HGW-Alphaproteobacteria-13]|nr:MAG: type II secretion system protein GspG [Alphaproteobacteria bacterium HGW-Alphaproteobacteria-13]